jgi:surface protein
MSSLFGDCKSLTELPDISIWDTRNVVNFGGKFSDCISLKQLPDISK